MKEKFEILAYRKYEIKGSGTVIQVVLGMPQQDLDTPNNDYYCPYRFEHEGHADIKKVYGVDAYQALQCALKIVDAELEGYCKRNKVEIEQLFEEADDSNT